MRLKILPLIVIFCSLVYSQNISIQIDSVKRMLESFEYMKVINASNKLLMNKELGASEKIEVLRMKASSHFSLWDEQATELCFVEILKLNQDYSLDSLRNSPKLITLFSKVKNDYLFELYRSQNAKDSLSLNILKPQTEQTVLVRKDLSYVKSMVLPGWGQLSKDENTKGWLIVVSGLASLGGAVYYSIRTDKTEKEYLDETNIHNIEDKYNSYNSNYRLRNLTVALYVSIWIYSQLDLLFPIEISTESKTNSHKNMLLFKSSLGWNSLFLNYSFSF